QLVTLPRNARAHRAPTPQRRADERLRPVAPHSGNLSGRTQRERRLTLPSSVSPREEGAHSGQVDTHCRWTSREDVFADRSRAAAAGGAAGVLAALRRRAGRNSQSELGAHDDPTPVV